jgi:hypothetical protein
MGAAGYLVKPFSIEELLDLMRSALGYTSAVLPRLNAPDGWGSATDGYHVRIHEGPKAGVWILRFIDGFLGL